MNGWHFPPLCSLKQEELREFLSTHPFSVIQMDAEWDGYAPLLAKKLKGASDAMPDVGFATMDSDREADYAKEIQLVNVPVALYFKGTELVAQVIGTGQDVGENIRRMKANEPIDTSNRISRK